MGVRMCFLFLLSASGKMTLCLDWVSDRISDLFFCLSFHHTHYSTLISPTSLHQTETPNWLHIGNANSCLPLFHFPGTCPMWGQPYLLPSALGARPTGCHGFGWSFSAAWHTAKWWSVISHAAASWVCQVSLKEEGGSNDSTGYCWGQSGGWVMVGGGKRAFVWFSTNWRGNKNRTRVRSDTVFMAWKSRTRLK